jgi:uncharacterized protein (TIGR03435 family)
MKSKSGYNCSSMAARAIPVSRLLSILCLCMGAQSPDLQFEVASLKPGQGGGQAGGQGGSIRPAPGGRRYIANNATLKLMLTVAYRVKASQISGGPGWMEFDPFDMNAEAERPSTIAELHIMLQNLIKERFKLQMHMETKERPVYVLSVDKAGVKMTPDEIGSVGDPWIEQPGIGKLTAKYTPMDYFAWLLSLFLDRPILDRTGLKGGYNFNLSWTPVLPAAQSDTALSDTASPGIFEALQKQLGLRLEPQKGPVDILVIDHAEKPDGN